MMCIWRKQSDAVKDAIRANLIIEACGADAELDCVFRGMTLAGYPPNYARSVIADLLYKIMHDKKIQSLSLYTASVTIVRENGRLRPLVDIVLDYESKTAEMPGDERANLICEVFGVRYASIILQMIEAFAKVAWFH